MRSILKILYLNQTAEAVLRFNKEGGWIHRLMPVLSVFFKIRHSYAPFR